MKDVQAEVNVNVGVGVQGAPDALQVERERIEEQKLDLKYATQKERDWFLNWKRQLKERDCARFGRFGIALRKLQAPYSSMRLGRGRFTRSASFHRSVKEPVA